MTYRRNGKLQACEPCRKGKLRCDHFMPHCGRCVKGGKTEQCVYHPAPMTRPTAKRSSHTKQTPPSAEEDRVPHQPFAGTERTFTAAANLARLGRIARPKRFASLSHPDQIESSFTASTLTPSLGPSASPSGRPFTVPSTSETLEVSSRLSDHQSVSIDTRYLEAGASFINHAAVLHEHEPSIGLSPPTSTSANFSVSQEHVDQGVSVLLLLRDLKCIRKYIRKWFSFAGGVVVIEPMVQIYMDGICSSWKKIFDNGKIEEMRDMSARIWGNTATPLSRSLHRKTTPHEFCASVTGKGLRWEIVGIIVSLVSLLTQSLKDGDPLFCSLDVGPVDRAALALGMHNASEMCVEFCDHVGSLNDLYLWLLYENSISYCSLHTRGSYDSWRKYSSFVAALQCANLHQGMKVDDNTPFFMAELRKRLFVCAYSNDKSIAAFAGRPPKLTRHYYHLQIPLDLTDAQTMSEGPELELCIADLDEKRWNQQRAVQRSTFARISATNALITEEILEISLGWLPPEEIVRRAVDIEARAQNAWLDLPDFLRLDIDDPWSSQRSPIESMFLIHIRLANLDHHFLLQRTLSKKVPPASMHQLLSICREIFRVVTMLVDNRAYFRDFQIDFVQILCAHGIPAASIIAVELLRQERDPTSNSTEAFPLHRSDTIQGLSVFVACLGTVGADTNNHQSCNRGRSFLKRILDMILGPGPAASRSVERENQDFDPTLGLSLFELENDDDFMRWLDDVRWDQETWINFT